jgi:P pilus assembly chaperone PapD
MSLLKTIISGRNIPTIRQGYFSFIIAAFSGFFLFFCNTVSAQGNLLITPKRVVLEGNKKSFDLSLSNTGSDTSTYQISIIQIRMKEDGGFEQITMPDSGQKFADKYLRFFPRQVTLGPNETQIVKVNLVRSGDLVTGEYRSHIYFRAVPKATPLEAEEKKSNDTTSFSVRLTPIFGISIPAIIRVGESSAKVSLTDLSLSFPNDTTPLFRFVFKRSGNMSVYGDVSIDHISPQGKITRVGIANGVAVYTPNTIRRFQLVLNRVQGIDYTEGTLRVYYSAPSDVKPQRYAEAELALRN